MALNTLYAPSRRLALPLPAGTAPGTAVKVGDIVGVTEVGNPPTSAGGVDGATKEVAVDGGFFLTVTGAVTNVGTKVYLASDGTVTATATGNAFLGYCLAVKGADAAVAPVILAGV